MTHAHCDHAAHTKDDYLDLTGHDINHLIDEHYTSTTVGPTRIPDRPDAGIPERIGNHGDGILVASCVALTIAYVICAIFGWFPW